MAPPRKKPRQSDVSILIPSNVSSPVPSHMQGSSGPAGIKPKLQSPPGEDGWTPEQETALLTAIIEHKPAGPLKHFRMVAISQAVQSRAQTGPPNEDEYIEEQHLAIPGIWKKLRTLYNMEAVWERADADLDAEDFNQDGSPSNRYLEFELPDEDFAQMIHRRRLKSGTASPVSSDDELVRPFQGLMQLPTPSTPRTSTPAALRRGKSAKGPIAALALATPSGSGRTTPARSSKRGRRATRGASIGDRASEDAATGLKADTGADQRSVTTPSVVAGDVVGLAVGTPGGEGEMLVVKRRRGRPPKIRDGVVGAGMGVAVALALAKKEEGKGTPSAVGRGKDKDREKKEEESGAEAEKEVRRSGRERHPSSLIKN